jgi:alkylation response protein AidB-like acyl-CoA dehydrogenase
VDLDLTPDQKSFQSTTRQFLERTAPLDRVRELGETPEGFERSWWRRGAELGWTAMLVPEALGGGTVSGAAVSDLVIVAEELGRACGPGPLTTTSAVLAGLVAAGRRFEDVVGEIVAGEKVAAWALYEPGHGLAFSGDLSRSEVRAEPDGEGFRLSGVKDRVEAGSSADLFLVSARSPEGPVQVLVPASAEGLTVAPAWTVDLVRRTARVEFAGVRVPADGVVQRGAAAVAAAGVQLNIAATLAAAETAGALGRTFEVTLQWMFDRYSFGRPLASYQALKHRMADHRTWLEACLATSAAAARALDDEPAGAPGADEAVSVAKSYVGAKAPDMMQDFVQLHGGIGVTWEHDLHLFLRRAVLNRALYGTPEEHRRRITDLMEVRVA